MKVIVADDEPVSRRLVHAILLRGGHEVLLAEDGLKAWDLLRQNSARMLIADWMMPGIDGLELVKRVRTQLDLDAYVYIIILTAKQQRQDLVKGLEAGADDYIRKPFSRDELILRVDAGKRVLQWEEQLRQKNRELQKALAEVKQLKGIIPICMHCKKIRDDQNYWHQLESYMMANAGADFSHGICPECLDKYYGDKTAAAETP